MNVLDYVMPVVMAMLAAALLLAVVRLLIGPSLPDRVVALDLVGLAVLSMVAAYSIQQNQPMLLRATAVVAMLSFLATTAFAYYVQKRKAP